MPLDPTWNETFGTGGFEVLEEDIYRYRWKVVK